MICLLVAASAIVGKENKSKDYRGARVKRTTVTAVECVSATGKLSESHDNLANVDSLSELGHRTHSWMALCVLRQWIHGFLFQLAVAQACVDPQTKELANKKPRVLICDGFRTHETLEVLEFCFENNIILCRIPSHTSHKLQPCDISVFSPLKSAYREPSRTTRARMRRNNGQGTFHLPL
jgi:hypothetical protein